MTDEGDWARQVVFYETPESRRDGNVCVGMRDGHAEVLPEAQFDELMR